VDGAVGQTGNVLALSLKRRPLTRCVRPVTRIGVAFVVTNLALLSACAIETSGASSTGKWSSAIQIGSKDSGTNQVSYSVSCPTSIFCVAANGNGQVLYDQSGVWSTPRGLALGGSIDSVSCSSTTFCVAVAAGEAAVYNGHRWSSAVRMGTTGDTYNVSCATVRFCAAVGASGLPGKPSALATFNGRTWSMFKTTSSGKADDRLLSVSCSSAHFCMAANLDGVILHFNGSTWTPSHGVGNDSLISVSCSTEKFCMAVTTTGDATTFHQGSWSPPKPIPSFARAGAYSVSCVSSSKCSVIGLSGSVATRTSGRWSGPTTVFSRGYVAGVSISCAATSHCVAVNDEGFAASR
jgi:hypothetical protein